MIGIIAAMDNEVDLLINNLENKSKETIAKFDFYKGKFKDKDVVIVKSGIGKVSASVSATLMINNYKPDYIINTGIAGGMKGLHSKDIVLGTKLTYSDVDVTAFNYKIGQLPGLPEYFESDKKIVEEISTYFNSKSIEFKKAVVLTADSFIVSSTQLKRKEEGNVVCEMEGTSIAQTCFLNNTKFVSIRYISDIIDSAEHIENYNKFEEEIAAFSAKTTYEIISLI